MVGVFGLVFICLIVFLLGFIAWGYFFGNGVRSLKNSATDKRISAQINRHIQEILGLNTGSIQAPQSTYLIIYATSVVNGVMSEVYVADSPDYKAIMNRCYGEKVYDYRLLALVFIGYSFANLHYVTGMIKSSKVSEYISSLQLSNKEKETIQESYNYSLIDRKSSNLDGYVSYAESWIVDILLQNVEAENSDPMASVLAKRGAVSALNINEGLRVKIIANFL